MIVAIGLLTLLAVDPHTVFAQESRRATEARDGASRQAEMASDSARSAQRAVRDSVRAERGSRPDNRGQQERPEREAREGRQSTPSEREARQADEGARENDRGLRGRDLSPEELKTQLENAKANEMSRHENRMAQIKEIRAIAEQNGNTNAMERTVALEAKEQAQHEKKMGRLLQMEERLAKRMSGEREPQGENENRSGREAGGGAEGNADDSDAKKDAGSGAEGKAGKAEQGQ